MSRWAALAGFCRYWRLTPAEALEMPLEMVEAFRRYQWREQRELERQAARYRR